MKKAAKKLTKKAVKKTSKRTENIVLKAGLSFGSVVDSVSRLHTEFLRQATHAVNVSLTLRNWLIGAYIHEYELRGADRAKYGENPVPELADALTKRGIPGCDQRELYRHRQFFRLYPQILGALTPKLQVHGMAGFMKDRIFQSLLGKLQLLDNKQVTQNSILGSLTPELTEDDDIPHHSGDEILEKLSYTHIAQLVGIDDPYKRVFYEMECLRGGWSVRELKRQISTLYFERTALSTNKAKLREIVKALPAFRVGGWISSSRRCCKLPILFKCRT